MVSPRAEPQNVDGNHEEASFVVSAGRMFLKDHAHARQIMPT